MTQERCLKLLLSPLSTEKTARVLENRQYAFDVLLDATKPEVKEAVETLFKVKVTAVNIVRAKPGTRVFRGRKGVVKAKKKAYVTLSEGDVISELTG